MEKLLQRGNIFELKRGMSVYADLPEKFIFANRPFSDEKHNHDIVVGRVYTTSNYYESVAKIENDVKEAIERPGLKVDKKQIEKFVNGIVPDKQEEQFDTSVFLGKYVVINTESSGSGNGMGQGDHYPDGWKVIAKKLNEDKFDPDGLEISFYQTGAFTAKIPSSAIDEVEDIFSKWFV